jgi:hypothetical protein
MNTTTTCRICGAPVTLAHDQRLAEALPEPYHRLVESVAKRICCNRCADFHRARRDTVEHLEKLMIRALVPGKEEIIPARLETIRENVTRIAMTLTKLICDYHRRPFLPQTHTMLLDRLMENPAKCRRIVYEFEDFVRPDEARAVRSPCVA